MFNGNDEVLKGDKKALNADGEAQMGDRKAFKDDEKYTGRHRSIEGQWRSTKRCHRDITW